MEDADRRGYTLFASCGITLTRQNNIVLFLRQNQLHLRLSHHAGRYRCRYHRFTDQCIGR
jgi:hypothetical protein